MAPNATIYHLDVQLSDVDRSVYERLDLRVARHPSETMRYLLTRLLAYALEYEDGIAFSKGGLSSTDDPPVAVTDPTGRMTAWIDVGSPSAERLHKASKAAPRVALYTSADLATLRREMATRTVFRLEAIAAWRVEPGFLDALDARVDRHTKLELLRTDGALYVTVDGKTVEGALERASLVSA